MKILVLCYEYPPIGGGGGRVAKSVAEELAKRGHEVRVQTAALGWRSVRETVGGVEVFRAASGRRVPDTCAVHEMGLFVATSFFPTLRHIRTWRPDVMHAHFAMPTGVLAWLAHLFTKVPYVLTAHLGDVPGGVPEQTDTLFQLVGPLARRVWQQAAAATAVSSFVQQLAEHAYGLSVTRILNGIELGDERPAPPMLSEPRHLVFLGRFNPQKRPQLLIDALAGMPALPWRATMIGDGPLMSAVRERVERHGLGSRVRLTGWLDGLEVQHILAGADILCMPSSSEGMPVAAVEALKHGLAIVASDVPGVRDVVENGVNGFRVSASTHHELQEKLVFLLEHESALLAMKRASWEKAREFDLRLIVDQYERVLQEARSNDKARMTNA